MTPSRSSAARVADLALAGACLIPALGIRGTSLALSGVLLLVCRVCQPSGRQWFSLTIGDALVALVVVFAAVRGWLDGADVVRVVAPILGLVVVAALVSNSSKADFARVFSTATATVFLMALLRDHPWTLASKVNWAGPATHPGLAGSILSLSLALWLGAHEIGPSKRRRGYWVPLVCLFAGLMTAASGFVVATTALAIAWLVRRVTASSSSNRSKRRRTALTMLIVAVGGLGLVWGVRPTRLSDALGEQHSTAARTVIWEETSRFAGRLRPLIAGVGIDSSWHTVGGLSALQSEIAARSGAIVTSAHNAYLEIWLSFGLPVAAWVVWRLLRRTSSALLGGADPFAFVALWCLVYSVYESSSTTWLLAVTWLTLVFKSGGLAKHAAMPEGKGMDRRAVDQQMAWQGRRHTLRRPAKLPTN